MNSIADEPYLFKIQFAKSLSGHLSSERNAVCTGAGTGTGTGTGTGNLLN